MVGPIDPVVLEALCPELRPLLEAELSRGNHVNETSHTWGLGGGTVWLLRRFRHGPIPPGVEFKLLDDPRTTAMLNLFVVNTGRC